MNQQNSSKILNKISIVIAIILILYALFNFSSSKFSSIIILISAFIVSPLSKRIFTKMERNKLRLLRIGVPIIGVLFGTIFSVFSYENKKRAFENRERELVKQYLKDHPNLYYLKQADSLFYWHNYFEGAYDNDENLEYLRNLLNRINYKTIHYLPNNNAYAIKKDSVNQTTTVIYTPEFIVDSISYEFQKSNKEDAINKYAIEFLVSSDQEIKSINALVNYNNGTQKLFDSISNNYSVENNLNKPKIKSQTEYIEARIRYAERAKLVTDFKKNCFSGWDGSHILLAKAIKNNMHNPDSFEHVDTQFKIQNDETAIIIMKYRGTNSFGATVTNSQKVKVDMNTCEIIKVFN
ncbi:hypothetical protein [Joostella sp. CR20]|uniref:hypothetical protein n=1 Tax=Joostella sp. CR20 TaxID=2804312 RepID=UPI00313DA2AC